MEQSMKIDGNRGRALRETRVEFFSSFAGIALLWARFPRKRQKGRAAQAA